MGKVLKSGLKWVKVSYRKWVFPIGRRYDAVSHRNV